MRRNFPETAWRLLWTANIERMPGKNKTQTAGLCIRARGIAKKMAQRGNSAYIARHGIFPLPAGILRAFSLENALTADSASIGRANEE